MDGRPLTFLGVLEHLEERIVDPEVVDYIRDIHAALGVAGQEIGRLQQIVEDHSRALSGPITAQYDPALHSIDEVTSRQVRLRLNPQLHEIRIPVDAKLWSEDHRHAFVKTTAEAIGQKAGRCFAKELWPDDDLPRDGR